jgi:hypothetical protein
MRWRGLAPEFLLVCSVLSAYPEPGDVFIVVTAYYVLSPLQSVPG